MPEKEGNYADCGLRIMFTRGIEQYFPGLISQGRTGIHLNIKFMNHWTRNLSLTFLHPYCFPLPDIIFTLEGMISSSKGECPSDSPSVSR